MLAADWAICFYLDLLAHIRLGDCDLQHGRWCGLLQGCCALFRQSTVTDVMDTSGHSSPILAYQANASHDEDRSRLGSDGFHDVLIDNLAASPSWRSSHISPVDVTALRRRRPKAVFRTMQRWAKVMLVIGQTGHFDTVCRGFAHM